MAEYPKGLLKAARKIWDEWVPFWQQKKKIGTPDEIYCVTFCNFCIHLGRLSKIQEKGDEDLGIEPGALLQINVSVDGAGVEHRHVKFHQVIKGQIDLIKELRQLNKQVGIDEFPDTGKKTGMEGLLDH